MKGGTQVCRSCGRRFEGNRFACTECDVGLVDEGPAHRVVALEGEGVAVPIEGRTFQQRTELVDHLEREGVLHRWEGHALVVDPDDAELVRALLADVEEAVDEMPEDEEVGYDLEDWTPDQQAELVGRLAEEGIPSRWEGGEVVVPEAHADRVEELIDEIDNPDAIPADEDDDDGGGELLGELFVVADVLQRDPTEPAAVADLLELAERVDVDGVPYGLDVAVWDGVRRMTNDVADLLGANADEEQVIAAARALRDALREMV